MDLKQVFRAQRWDPKGGWLPAVGRLPWAPGADQRPWSLPAMPAAPPPQAWQPHCLQTRPGASWEGKVALPREPLMRTGRGPFPGLLAVGPRPRRGAGPGARAAAGRSPSSRRWLIGMERGRAEARCWDPAASVCHGCGNRATDHGRRQQSAPFGEQQVLGEDVSHTRGFLRPTGAAESHWGSSQARASKETGRTASGSSEMRDWVLCGDPPGNLGAPRGP